MDLCVAMSHDIQDFSTFCYHKLLFFFFVLVVPIPAWHGDDFSLLVYKWRKRKQYLFVGFGKRNIRDNFGSLPSCLYGPHVSWHPEPTNIFIHVIIIWTLLRTLQGLVGFLSYFPSCSEISSSECETQLHDACRSLKINHPIVYHENVRVNSLLHCLDLVQNLLLYFDLRHYELACPFQ